MAQRVRSVASGRAPRSGRPKTRVIGPFSIIAEKLVILAAIVSGGALIYLVYGAASGHLTSFPYPPADTRQPLSEAAQAALLHYVATATRILAWGAVIGTVLALARYYDSPGTIAATGAVGALLYLGLPLLLALELEHQYRTANAATDMVILGVQAAGKAILVLAAARGAVHVFLAATRGRRRTPVRTGVGAGKPQAMRPRSLLRQCWELARCRAPGAACPSFRERRACWKRGSGCLCDLKLAEKLARGAEAWAHEEVVALRYRASLGRAPCRACPLYEEHQEHKFRLTQWLAYPAAAGLIFAARPLLHLGYDRFLDFMERMLAVLAFAPGRVPTMPPSGGVESMVLSSNVEWVFIGCLGLILLTYMLQGIERAIFKWGW